MRTSGHTILAVDAIRVHVEIVGTVLIEAAEAGIDSDLEIANGRGGPESECVCLEVEKTHFRTKMNRGVALARKRYDTRQHSVAEIGRFDVAKASGDGECERLSHWHQGCCINMQRECNNNKTAR